LNVRLQEGLLIEVIDPSSRTIHKEIVYPEGEHRT
jgi:hypothetical protein